ncbi:hypothetical protein B0T16DRAFT_181264 [Cercophora newfieldiana]|uniref:Heterokaryon incompatibility domain-containing protein n=1 Tax=Cercophora newfieldiana TaxID=92897 RepID=A0AA40CN11_9PEZI|nr:hypothetical protein B0T16DRAFT_181264 [Cercophora newfieldiana]
MRLINVHTRRLELLDDDPTEDYAILSHTWGKAEDELSFQDMSVLAKQGANRTAKLDGCCEQAKKDGLKYVWIDTCCIDKKSTAELSEAIHSMFKWYQRSKFCYTYLSDIEPGQPRERIPESRWFTRGWTLQELLASPRMKFFDSEWNHLGTKLPKSPLLGLIVHATGIPHHILTGFASLDTASVAQRFSWASRRQTTRPEDMAYCLLGIFDVIIPLFYGEGLEAAFERLQEAIMRKNLDDSILAWSTGPPEDRREQSAALTKSGGILAPSPTAFEGCGNIVRRPQTEARIQAFETFGGMVPINISLSPILSDPLPCARYGYLSCGPESHQDRVVAIPLAESQTELSSVDGTPVYLRPRGLNSVISPKPAILEAPSKILVRKDRAENMPQPEYRPPWFYLRGPYPLNATVEDVYPPEFYESEVAVIKTPRSPDSDKTLLLIRFSNSTPDSDDQAEVGYFLVGIEYSHDSSTSNKEPRACLYIDDDPQIPLSEIAGLWESLAKCWATGIVLAVTPLTGLIVSLKMEIIAGHHLWVVKLSELPPSHNPKFPPDWPRISHQIHIRKEGHTLVQLLRRGAAESRQSKAVARELLHHDEETRTTQHNLERVVEERKILEARERDLRFQLKKRMADREILSEEAKASSEAQKAIDKRLAEAEETGTLAWSKTGKFTELQTKLGPESSSLGFFEELQREKEREGIIAYLMQQDPTTINGEKLIRPRGFTLLMYAAASGDAEFIKRVVCYDADVATKDSTERTALDWAELAGSKECRELLSRLVKETKSHGTDPGDRVRDLALEGTRPSQKGKEAQDITQENREGFLERENRQSKDSGCYPGQLSLEASQTEAPTERRTRVVDEAVRFSELARTGATPPMPEVRGTYFDYRRKSKGSIGRRSNSGTLSLTTMDEELVCSPGSDSSVGMGGEKKRDLFGGLGRLARRVSDKVAVAPASSATTQFL